MGLIHAHQGNPGRRYGWLVFVYSLLLTTCQTAPTPTLPPITPTTPSTTLHIGLDESAAALADLIPNTLFNVQFVINNNSTLLADLDDRQVDAILTHVIPPEETRWFNPVALDGLSLIVHPDNPVTELGLSEVQAIFSGKIGNWSAVGGADSPITLVGRERGSGVRALFNERVMGSQRMVITAMVEVAQAEVVTQVAGDVTAIGYVMMGGVDDGVRPLILDGYAPTPTHTASQNYPLTVPLYFLAPTANEPQGELRAFLAWLQSTETQEILGQTWGRVR